MRTTIRLDDQLLNETKRVANEKGRSMTSVIEDALREMLARRSQAAPNDLTPLPTMSGALRPGVDLDDSAALLDLMEAFDDTPGR